jgi:hypothetical protein
MEKGRFAEIHRKWFSQLLRLPGFTCNLSYGVSIDRTLHEGSENDMDVDGDDVAVGGASLPPGVADVDEDQEDEDHLTEKCNALAVTMDEKIEGLDIYDFH